MTTVNLEQRRQIAQKFMEMIPHCRELGMRTTALEPGEAWMEIDYDPRYIGDPETGVLHGGVVTSLLDSCCGSSVVMHPSGVMGTATIDLRIDYMRPSTPGKTLRAHATCYHMTRNVAFVRATAYEDDEGDPVASAAGAFTIERQLKTGVT